MKLLFKRIIIFTYDVPLLLGYYIELLKTKDSYIDEDGKWGEILLPNINIAFHHGKIRKSIEKKFKLVFFSKDIPKCRLKLIKRGYLPGKIFSTGKLEFFNLNDPDGNAVQFSNRK